MARPNRLRSEKNHDAPYYLMMRDAERVILRDFLAACDGSIAEAAKMLGVSYAHVHRRLQLLGGVLPNEPRREPFDPKMRDSDEEREDDDSPADEADDDSTESTDDVDGEARSADAS